MLVFFFIKPCYFLLQFCNQHVGLNKPQIGLNTTKETAAVHRTKTINHDLSLSFYFYSVYKMVKEAETGVRLRLRH